MNIRPTPNRSDIQSSNLLLELVEIVAKYREIVFQTHKLVQDSKEYTEYRWIQGNITQDVYERRIQNLVNMALLYYYGLYEGFTRQVLFTMEVKFGAVEEEIFNKRFSKF